MSSSVNKVKLDRITRVAGSIIFAHYSETQHTLRITSLNH